MEKSECDVMKHYEHLCSLKKSSCSEEEIAKLQMDPMYECKTCGGKAREAKNLCTPSTIGT